jgi:hypothetical protein
MKDLRWMDDTSGHSPIMDHLSYTLLCDGVPVAQIGNADGGGNVQWWILPNELGILLHQSARMRMQELVFTECEMHVSQSLAE